MTDTFTAGARIETDGVNLLEGEPAGTIGAFAQDADGNPVLISCSHVIFDSFVAAPDTMVYSPKHSTCCGGHKIAMPVFDPTTPAVQDPDGWHGGYREGMWYGGFTWLSQTVTSQGVQTVQQGSETDCAAARLLPGIPFKNEWRVGGTTIPLVFPASGAPAFPTTPPRGTPPVANQWVRFYSAVTGQLQYGTMYPRDGMRRVAKGTKPLLNLYPILPRPTPPASGVFPDQKSYEDSYRTVKTLDVVGGQSGSFVINSNNEIIAMIVAAGPLEALGVSGPALNSLEFAKVCHVALAMPIAKVLSMLKVTIPQAAGGWGGTVPAAAPGRLLVPGFGPRVAVDAAALARTATVARVRERLTTSVRGRLLLGLIGRHRQEAYRLLRTVAPVTAAWRSFGGPAYVHHCVRSVERGGHRIPSNINGISRARLVDIMLPLLRQHGSDGLRRDLDRYATLLRDDLIDIESIMDVPEALARPGALV